MVGLHCFEYHELLAMLQCTHWLHSAHASASLNCSLLLSRDRRQS